jgi:hypothetical protein
VKLYQSLKLLSLIVLVNMADGIVMTRSGAGAEHKRGTTAGKVQPDSVSQPKKKEELDSTVVYTARDSLIYNFDKRTADLFGKARVDYKGMKIEGPRITVYQKSTTIHTSALKDSRGKVVELPVFTDSTGSFTAEEMTYNYQTRYGQTTNVSSKNDQGFYTGAYVRRLPSGVLYIRDGTYTTCDLEEPHYWFAGKEMKIIPDDRLTSRPFIMYIHPEIFSHRLPVIPLIPLPFMSVPITNKRSSGFLYPRVGRDGNRGIYLSNLGYFWAISDYTDLRLESDYAFNGSWRLGERFRYSNRNHYSGSIEGEYETFLINHRDDPNYAEYRNSNIRIIHHQEFDPTSKLDINLQYIGGNRYYDINSINPESIITEQATSYASFYKAWDEGNRVLTAGYQRVDNLVNDDLAQTFTASLYQNRIYPFRPRIGAQQSDWSSRLSIQPSASVTAKFTDVSGIRTDMYTGNAGLDVGFLQDFAPGYKALFTQAINVQGQFKATTQQSDLNGTMAQYPLKVQSTLFGHLNLTPSLTFSQYHVNSTVRKSYNGGVQTATVSDPADYSTLIFSVDAQTRLYHTYNTGFLENLIGLKAIRHTFIPTVTFTCNPDYQGEGYSYYGSYYNPVTQSVVRYNRFEQSLYPLIPQERRWVGVSLQNLFHGKFRNSGASNDPGVSDRVVQLLSLTAASGYNFAADSFRIDPLTLTASGNALAPGLMVTAGAMYDFYSYDPVTRTRINKLNADEGKGLLRFLNGYVNMSMSIGGHLRDRFDPEVQSGQESVLRKDGSKVEQAIFRDRFDNGELVEFSPLLPWSLRMSLYLVSDKNDPLNPVNTALLDTSAKLSLSRHWQAGLNTGYDLRKNSFVFPSIMLYRDLHDFQFSFQWVPSGQYQSFKAQIAMKPPMLRDLKFTASGALNHP